MVADERDIRSIDVVILLDVGGLESVRHVGVALLAPASYLERFIRSDGDVGGVNERVAVKIAVDNDVEGLNKLVGDVIINLNLSAGAGVVRGAGVACRRRERR